MPGKPFQSKLEPFLDLIRDYRSKRWSYSRIAGALRTEHGIAVAPSTIFSFVKVRSKGRKVFALPPHDQPSSAPRRSSPLAKGGPEFFEKPPASNAHEPRPYKLDF